MVSLFLWFLLSVTQACQCWRTEIACNSGRGQERKPTHFIHASYHYHTTSQKEREREKEGEGGLKKKTARKKAQKIPPDGLKEECVHVCVFSCFTSRHVSVMAHWVFPCYLHSSYLTIIAVRHLSLQLLVNQQNLSYPSTCLQPSAAVYLPQSISTR